MKPNVLYAILVVVAGTLFTCKSSDPAPSLAGTWKVSSYSVTGCTNSSDNIPDTPCGTSGTSVTIDCDTWVITSTQITVNGISTISFDYTTSGSTMTFKVSGVTVATATYTVSATTLSITTDLGSSPGCKIVTNLTRL